MRFMCRIEILFRQSKRKSNTVQQLSQYRQTCFMKNRDCLLKVRKSLRPIVRRKIIIVGGSESLLNVCGFARVQTAQAGAAITVGFGFRRLRKVKERDTPSEQLVYNALRHAMIL